MEDRSNCSRERHTQHRCIHQYWGQNHFGWNEHECRSVSAATPDWGGDIVTGIQTLKKKRVVDTCLDLARPYLDWEICFSNLPLKVILDCVTDQQLKTCSWRSVLTRNFKLCFVCVMTERKSPINNVITNRRIIMIFAGLFYASWCKTLVVYEQLCIHMNFRDESGRMSVRSSGS